MLNVLWEYLAEKGILLSRTSETVPDSSRYNRRNNVFITKGDDENTVRFWRQLDGTMFKSRSVEKDADIDKMIKDKVFSKPPKKK